LEAVASNLTIVWVTSNLINDASVAFRTTRGLVQNLSTGMAVETLYRSSSNNRSSSSGSRKLIMQKHTGFVSCADAGMRRAGGTEWDGSADMLTWYMDRVSLQSFRMRSYSTRSVLG
jgi:hypothetical protein